MGQLPYRRTSTRGLRGATLALLCLLGLLLAPAAATAQATTGGAKAPAAKTATTEPDATDAVTSPAAGADGAAAGPDTGATTPDAGAATPDVPAADPNAPAADPAAVDPNAPAATPDAQTTPAPTGAEGTQTTGVVVQEPDDSLPGWVWGAVAVGIVAAALVAWLLVLASGRFERLAPVGHALGEAGWRLSNRWAEFMDWLRFGSGR